MALVMLLLVALYSWSVWRVAQRTPGCRNLVRIFCRVDHERVDDLRAPGVFTAVPALAEVDKSYE